MILITVWWSQRLGTAWGEQIKFYVEKLNT